MLTALNRFAALPNGTDECTNCASVGISPIPIETRRIRILAHLPSAVSAAIIYLMMVPYYDEL